MGLFSKEKQQIPQIQITSPDIQQQFQEAFNRNEVAEVLRELFVENKIYLITDLTKDEIKLATRIYMLAEMKDIKAWKSGLKFFVTLMLSKDRKSRKELLEAMKGQIGNQSFFNKLNPFNKR
jgi:uncharacterized membrane protein